MSIDLNDFPWRFSFPQAPLVDATPAAVDAPDVVPMPSAAPEIPQPVLRITTILPPAAFEAEPAQETQPMSFGSVFTSALSAVGHGLKVFFAGAEKVAVAAEPFVDLLFPSVSVLYNGIVAEVGKAEAAAIAASAQTGTGAQKLALVVSAVESNFAAYEKANGITVPHTQEQITAAVDGVVAFLNALTATPAV